MGSFSIPIKGVQVERKLTHVLRRESPSLEFKGDKTLKVPMVEEQIELEVLTPDLDTNLFPHKGEAFSQLHQQSSEVQQQTCLEVCLTMGFGEVDEVQDIAVLEDADHVLQHNSQQCCEF